MRLPPFLLAVWGSLAVAGATGCTPKTSQAAFPLSGVQIHAGEQVTSAQQFAKRTAASAAVCVGEQHDDAAHHAVQKQVLDGLIEQAERGGVQLALGMEMFRRHMQPALNAYGTGEIDSDELRRATNWDRTWGFDFSMYRPMLETARAHGVRIIGLNAPRSLTRAIARHGLASLPAEVRDSLPALRLDDADHKKFFWAVMGFDAKPAPMPSHGQHGGHHGHHRMKPENFYAAQVVWDETMAEGVSSWLADPAKRQMLVVAGNGHCHRTAIPNRAARRARGKRMLSVLLQSSGDDLPPHTQSDFVIQVTASSPSPSKSR